MATTGTGVLCLVCLTARQTAARPLTCLVLLGALVGCAISCRRQLADTPEGMMPYPAAVLAGALLLPPGPAALVTLPGGLLTPSPGETGPLRRCWNTAQRALATALAAALFDTAGGPRLLARADVPPLLGLAAAVALVFCLVGTVLLATVRTLADDAPWGRGLRTLLRRSAAPCLANGLVALLAALLWQRYGPLAAAPVMVPLAVADWAGFQARRAGAAHQAAVRALVQAVEIKDGYTRGHSERVSRAAGLMGGELRMPEARKAALRTAGLLHDVGKLGVPTRVLRKSGPLTDEEFRAIERHPQYGHEVVRGIAFLAEARAGILHHHERMDGRGYPAGLAGRQIPEFARVIAVADAFDSMTSTRSYRRGRPVPEAFTELERCSGTQFDPQMVAALISAVGAHGWQTAPRGPGDDDAPDVPLGLSGQPRRPPAPSRPPTPPPPPPRPPADAPNARERAPADRCPRAPLPPDPTPTRPSASDDTHP